MRFPLGQTVATAGALQLLKATGTSPGSRFARHQKGDWGDVPPEDARENDILSREGFPDSFERPGRGTEALGHHGS